MPQYNKMSLDQAASSLGFSRDTFEKVLRLKEILSWLNQDELLQSHLLLKGGTAINLTIFNLPRLSVDIDMDYSPNDSRERMMEIRAAISDRIINYMASENYVLSPASRLHHSLDALHFFYQNAAGNKDMIKLEINYSLRSHLFPAVKLDLLPSVFDEKTSVMTVDPMEIFAAKMNALMSRAAARDLYDINNMINHRLFEQDRNLFRKCIIFYASISQETISTHFDASATKKLSFAVIRRDLFPVLKQDERRQMFELDKKIAIISDYIENLMTLSVNEKEYIKRFNNHEYRPELLFDDPDIVARIKQHPMALWKCK